MKLSGPGLLFVEIFDYWFNPLTTPFRFFISLWIILGRLYVYSNLFISPRLSDLLAYNVHSSLVILCLSVVSAVMSPLISDLIWALSLLFLWVYTSFLWTFFGTQIFIAALFLMAKRWRQPECLPVDIHKQNMVHPSNELVFTIKRNKILILATTGKYIAVESKLVVP